MGSPSSKKKLVYLLNYVDESDIQHFVHVLNLLGAMRARGWSVSLLSEKGGVGKRLIQGQEVLYLSRSSKVLRLCRLVYVLLLLRFRGYRLVFVRISKVPALIASALGKLIGLKVVYWQSGATRDFDRGKPVMRRLIDDAQMNLLIAMVTRFVTGPETMITYYEREFGVPAKKLMLLYNDIDLARFPATDRVRAPGEPVRILFVHRFSPVRQAVMYLPFMIERLNQAAREGLAIQFDLAGDGPERPKIEQIVRSAEKGVTIRLLGALPNVSLPQRYIDADIFVMPSYREGMPRAIMEAMATGLPAVSTDAGGTRDLVGPLQDKFVVSRDAPQEFADRLYDLVRDAALRRAIGAENGVRMQRYSTDVVADMYDAKLSALIQ